MHALTTSVETCPSARFCSASWEPATRETQVAWRGDARHVAGSSRRPPLPSFLPGELQISETKRKGTLDSLGLAPATARRDPGPGEVEIEVVAAGLNFRDVVVSHSV